MTGKHNFCIYLCFLATLELLSFGRPSISEDETLVALDTLLDMAASRADLRENVDNGAIKI